MHLLPFDDGVNEPVRRRWCDLLCVTLQMTFRTRKEGKGAAEREASARLTLVMRRLSH